MPRIAKPRLNFADVLKVEADDLSRRLDAVERLLSEYVPLGIDMRGLLKCRE